MAECKAHKLNSTTTWHKLLTPAICVCCCCCLFSPSSSIIIVSERVSITLHINNKQSKLKLLLNVESEGRDETTMGGTGSFRVGSNSCRECIHFPTILFRLQNRPWFQPEPGYPPRCRQRYW